MRQKTIYLSSDHQSDFMTHIRAAMEAEGDDDLTVSTNDAMRRVNSSSNRPSTDPTRTSEETQREDAASTERGNMSGDVNAATPDDPAGTSPVPDEGADDTGMSDMGESGDDLGMDEGGDMGGDDFGSSDMDHSEELPPANPEQGRQIINLQTNMNEFYQKISNMLNILSNYAAPSSDKDLRDLYNNCVEYVAEVKNILEEMFEAPITSINYANKLRKYVALRHAYSTILDMLDIHFQVLTDQNGQNSKVRHSDTQTAR